MGCENCGEAIGRHSSRYCSNQCQLDYQYKAYIRRWKAGLEDGRTGKASSQLSKHIKRFLAEKYGEKCCICGWDHRHLITGKVPLEVNHIDGDSSNNEESNLQLICPNCHSLTINFRNLNKGKGRAYRRKAALQNAA